MNKLDTLIAEGLFIFQVDNSNVYKFCLILSFKFYLSCQPSFVTFMLESQVWYQFRYFYWIYWISHLDIILKGDRLQNIQTQRLVHLCLYYNTYYFTSLLYMWNTSCISQPQTAEETGFTFRFVSKVLKLKACVQPLRNLWVNCFV